MSTKLYEDIIDNIKICNNKCKIDVEDFNDIMNSLRWSVICGNKDEEHYATIYDILYKSMFMYLDDLNTVEVSVNQNYLIFIKNSLRDYFNCHKSGVQYIDYRNELIKKRFKYAKEVLI